MIHEIYPKEYKVQYVNCTPASNDTIFLFDGDNICCRLDGGDVMFPRLEALSDIQGPEIKFVYLFSIDEERFFMPDIRISKSIMPPEGYECHVTNTLFRTAGPRHLAFAAVTAQALYKWYASNVYCGSCSADMAHSETERACICTKCEDIVYPKISPVVIVAVTHGENLLLTRYRDRPYRNYALVAGFAENGESFEEAVKREVLEETGVRVKNIKYYKSQPWGFTSTLLAGFFCELDGDPTIEFDENELSEAIWLPRGEIPPATLNIALTSEMIEVFRTGQNV